MIDIGNVHDIQASFAEKCENVDFLQKTTNS